MSHTITLFESLFDLRINGIVLIISNLIYTHSTVNFTQNWSVITGKAWQQQVLCWRKLPIVRTRENRATEIDFLFETNIPQQNLIRIIFQLQID